MNNIKDALCVFIYFLFYFYTIYFYILIVIYLLYNFYFTVLLVIFSGIDIPASCDVRINPPIVL